MKTSLITALFLGLSIQATQAEEITLSKPMQGASLHEGNIDMSVYFLDVSGTYEVVATYVDAISQYDPYRLRMGLSDGDAVRFALPGLRHVMYAFERHGDILRVTAASLTNRVTEVID